MVVRVDVDGEGWGPGPPDGTRRIKEGGTGVGVGRRRKATLSCLATPVRLLRAAVCRDLPGRERKYLLFLGPPTFSQAEGRRFEPGLALQFASNRTLA